MSDQKIDPRWYIAPSVSKEARARLEAARAFIASLPVSPLPETLADFDAAAERGANVAERFNRAILDALAPVVAERILSGVPTLDVRPRDYSDDGTTLIYIHGGA
jgi:epsilon-lactone hydrolase